MWSYLAPVLLACAAVLALPLAAPAGRPREDMAQALGAQQLKPPKPRDASKWHSEKSALPFQRRIV